MMRTLLIALAIAGNAAAQDFSGLLECPYNDGQPTDFVTYLCLLGIEDHSEPAWCAELAPGYGAPAREAHRGWLDRNAGLFQEIQSACDARLLRAYGGDRTAIATARQDAKQRDQKNKDEIRARYWSGTQPVLNCSSYIHQMKEAKDEERGFTKILQSIRECRARPVRWPDQ
jgi:hypothetical protein